ncbi:60s ribosomal protein L18 [Moesziomyces antarcticus T-34]|uniref:60s ribosomal protein L18 n=1 Tax=Pseudozyma antarctica (strain T-34) TaxID=1151754 RepID=M9MIV4_PSEA3|nr:60s ribosomal protein L18 [Moesziomyces antarcticus T-34]
MLVADEAMGAAAESFRQALQQARHPIALAGAGLSAASGIPTFRGAGATPEAFKRDPSKVWQFYHYRRSVVLAASPNAAHKTLAKLMMQSPLREHLLPNAQSFHLITQNVDGLSGRALQEFAPSEQSVPSATAGSILEMHGNLFKTICTSCGDSRIDLRDPLCPALRGAEDLSGEYRAIPTEHLPRCSQFGCNGLLRPGVVWFGESIPELNRIQPLISRCDLILVLGTSSTVYPAAGFAQIVKHSNHGQVAVFNIEEPSDDERDDVDWHFVGPVETLLPQILSVTSDS